MKKLSAKILLLVLICLYMLPLTALAAGDSPPPREPYEKVAAKKGTWYAEQIAYDGKSNLVVGYKGSYETEAAEPILEFKLSEKILLTGVYVPYQGMETGEVELTILDSRGNMYQGFAADQAFTGGIREENTDIKIRQAAGERNTSYTFIPQYNLTLPKGDYALYLDGAQLPVDACLIKGYSFPAYKRYLEKLQEWAWENEEREEAAEAFASFGNEDLSELFEQFMVGEESEEEPEWEETPRKYIAPVFALDGEYTIDEIILSTWNNGEGANPGVIKILDEAKKEVAAYKAQGASQGGAANTLWVVGPGITLPAGAYTIDMDAQDALDFDETGQPVFYIGTSVPAPPPFNYSGTYRIWLDVFKTRTLAGLADSGKVSFDLNDFELTVLDKGSFIELIGQYEGIPFSQNCEVLEREEKSLKAAFNFMADLTKLSYDAKIGARAEVTLSQGNAGRVDIAMGGTASYSREATKERGADQNSYDLALRGNRVKKDLPPFVMTAIAKAYGAGNVPGPDSPAQAAAGILFPPLVGLVVSVLQELLKPKERIPDLGNLPTKLSVGEQAMKDANQSLGKGLYSEEEAKAWAMMADALGASGGDAEDAVSIGDNERPGGADYVAPQESSGGGGYDDYDSQDYGSDEDLSFGKPDVPDETPGYAPPGQDEQPYTGAQIPAEPESMVVTTSAHGAQTLITRDPATGQWVNAETGNPFDLEAHQKNFPKQVKEYDEFTKHNEELEKTGQTAMQKGLDEISKKEKEGFDAIQKEIDKRRIEQLKREQESLEWEMEHAQKTSGWGRIIGDTVKNAGDEVVDAAKTLGKGAKDAVVWTGETLGTTVGMAVYDPEQALKNIGESYESVKNTLGAAKDKVVGAAQEVYNKPWIVVQGVMNTGKAVVDTVTDPKKAWEFAKDTVGAADFEKSLDPNLSLIDRIGHTFAGTVKLGATIGTAGQAGAALKGAGKLAGVADDLLAAGGKKLATKAPVQGIKPALEYKVGPTYATNKKTPNLAGVTKTSQKIIQNTADDFGVQIKARPTTPQAEKWLNSGKAAPKPLEIKAKTLNKMDELLGGPQGKEGLVGYYKPKLPPEGVMKNLSQETQKKLIQQYEERSKEFSKLADTMKQYEKSGKYTVADGVVYNKNGKVITGDVDIFDIVNYDGSPVKESVKKQVIASMSSKKGSNVMHEGLMSWEKGGVDFSQAAKDKMIDAATKSTPGKGLTSYNPLSGPTSQVYKR